MRTVLATYKGYYNDHFIFIVEKKEIKFAPFEVTVVDLHIKDLIKLMQRNIGHLYKLAVFWDSYGYYVIRNDKGEWDMHDGLTHIYTGVSFDNFENIPTKYMDKPIQKYQRKLLLAKIK